MSADSVPSREALAELVRGIVMRHGGPTAVGERVGAHRTTVHHWMQGDVSLSALGTLADKLEEPIVLRFGTTTKDAPPPGGDEALQRVRDEIIAEIRLNRDAMVAALAAHFGELTGEVLQQLPDGPAPVDAHPGE